jgi:hypothetical protein
VVQQAQGRVRPTLQMQEGVPVNDDVGLEREADVMGAKALKKKQKVNNTILNAVQGGGSADAVQQKTEKNANTDISDCLEEDIESHTTGPVRSEIKDIALEREDDEPPYSDEEAMAQTQVTQLQPSRRRSNRIATNLQNQARRTRRNRLGRHRGIVRLVPGGPVRTRRMRVAALGGRYGLLCPVGSYAQVRRNFNYTGSRAGDAAALGGTPPGHVWHHYHDFVPSATPNAGHGTMYLLRIEQHLPRHLGGVYQWNHTPGNRRYG